MKSGRETIEFQITVVKQPPQCFVGVVFDYSLTKEKTLYLSVRDYPT